MLVPLGWTLRHQLHVKKPEVCPLHGDTAHALASHVFDLYYRPVRANLLCYKLFSTHLYVCDTCV